MSKWDNEYIKLCKEILNNGNRVVNRSSVDTISIPSYNLRFNLNEEFPVLTTKQLYFRQAILEMLWIYQEQSNDVRWLQSRNVHIWDKWEIDENGIWKSLQNVFENGKCETKEISKQFDLEYAHTIGTAYGFIVKKYNLIDNLINTIKNNPSDRRMIMSLWQNEYIDTAVLPSCVWSTEWNVSDGYLNCLVHQRSCDVPLGLPFNVTQYAVLVSLIASITDLKPGVIDWSIKDAHIYVNQVDGILEQIKRYDENGSLESGKLWINPEIKDFYKFDNSENLNDIKIVDYKHMGKIDFLLTD